MASITFILVAAFLSTIRFSEGSSNCSESSESVCQIDRVPKVFPLTHEELDATCERGLEFMACRLEHLENCGKNEETLIDMRSYIHLLERVCDKETYLYRDIVDNLACIKKGIYQESCDLQNEEEFTKFEDQLKEHGINNVANENGDYPEHCIHQMHSLACRAASIGNECGEPERDAVTEIFQNLIYISDNCSEETVHEFQKIVRILQAENLKEEVEESLEE